MASRLSVLAAAAGTEDSGANKINRRDLGAKDKPTPSIALPFCFLSIFLLRLSMSHGEKKKKAPERAREARELVQGADKDRAVVGLGAHHQAVGTGSGRGQALDELVLGGGRLDHVLVVDANPFAGEALHQFLLVRLIVLPLSVGLCFTPHPHSP